MSKGYVYILTNEHMPGLVKIGRTTGQPSLRAQQLFQTGVPSPFVVEHAALSPDCVELENTIHEHFEKFRVSADREFFRVTPEDAFMALEEYMREQVREIVEEFWPGQTVIPFDDAVCSAKLHQLASAFDTVTAEIASAMSFMTSEDLMPAMMRWRQRVARLSAQKVKTDG